MTMMNTLPLNGTFASGWVSGEGGERERIVESQLEELVISELPDAASILWYTSVYLGV